MLQEYGTGAVDICDPVISTHTVQRTDLVKRHQQSVRAEYSPDGLEESDDFLNFAIDKIKPGEVC